MGNVISAAGGQAPARQAALGAGKLSPISVSSMAGMRRPRKIRATGASFLVARSVFPVIGDPAAAGSCS